MGWSIYYSGNFQGATQNIQMWLDVLNDTTGNTKGIERDQFKAMQCRLLSLASCSARDRMQNKLALQRSNEAVALALELNNMDLTGLSLYRRIRIFLPLNKTDEAISDVNQALQNEDVLSDDVRGILYVVAGEAYAQKSRHDRSLQTTSLRYLDKAAHIARKLKGAPDTHLLSFNLTPVMNERAATFSAFGMKSDARNSVAIAGKELDMNNVRWTKDYYLAEADTALADEDVTNTASALLETVKVSDSTHSKSNMPYIMRIYEKCLMMEPNNPMLGRLGDVLGV
jgi:tetratricopeptide (TPR) repeat protein